MSMKEIIFFLLSLPVKYSCNLNKSYNSIREREKSTSKSCSYDFPLPIQE